MDKTTMVMRGSHKISAVYILQFAKPFYEIRYECIDLDGHVEFCAPCYYFIVRVVFLVFSHSHDFIYDCTNECWTFCVHAETCTGQKARRTKTGTQENEQTRGTSKYTFQKISAKNKIIYPYVLVVTKCLVPCLHLCKRPYPRPCLHLCKRLCLHLCKRLCLHLCQRLHLVQLFRHIQFLPYRLRVPVIHPARVPPKIPIW